MTKHPFILMTGLCLALVVATFAVGSTLSTPDQISWGAELGPLEDLAAVFFGLAALCGAAAWVQTRATGWAVYAVLLAAATMRELDWHSKWTAMSVLKLRFYSSPGIAWTEKAIGAVIILLLLAAAIYALRRLPDIIRALHAGSWQVTVAVAAAGFILLSKCIDSLFRLAPGLTAFRPEYGDLLRVAEEAFEAYAGLLFVMAAVIGTRSGKTKR
ncbi:MAG: hypothetical protein V4621_03770 [Pseudomonadota bacterium]